MARTATSDRKHHTSLIILIDIIGDGVRGVPLRGSPEATTCNPPSNPQTKKVTLTQTGHTETPSSPWCTPRTTDDAGTNRTLNTKHHNECPPKQSNRVAAKRHMATGPEGIRRILPCAQHTYHRHTHRSLSETRQTPSDSVRTGQVCQQEERKVGRGLRRFIPHGTRFHKQTHPPTSIAENITLPPGYRCCYDASAKSPPTTVPTQKLPPHCWFYIFVIVINR